MTARYTVHTRDDALRLAQVLAEVRRPVPPLTLPGRSEQRKAALLCANNRTGTSIHRCSDCLKD